MVISVLRVLPASKIFGLVQLFVQCDVLQIFSYFKQFTDVFTLHSVYKIKHVNVLLTITRTYDISLE